MTARACCTSSGDDTPLARLARGPHHCHSAAPRADEVARAVEVGRADPIDHVGNPDLIGITGAASRGASSLAEPCLEELASSPRIGGIVWRRPFELFPALGPADIEFCSGPALIADDNKPRAGVGAGHVSSLADLMKAATS